METLEITSKHPYNVVIGSGIIKDTGKLLREIAKPCKVCIITDSNVNGIFSQVVISSLIEAGFQTSKILFPAGEHSKNINTYTQIVTALTEERMNRQDIIIALGGGVVGDVAGFVAATYMRGIRYVYVPTTPLAAIDGSIGGKTALNLPTGKNLIGAFWHPSLVICDYNAYSSLPESVIMDGLAEGLKSAVISDSSLLPHIETRDFKYILSRCLSLRKSFVEADQEDTGIRQMLDFGHTIGHAIERLSCYNISHGQALAKGMIAEAKGAFALGLTNHDISGQLEYILKGLGFDTSLNYSPQLIYEHALIDKKICHSTISVIAPMTIGKCTLQKLPLANFHQFLEASLA